MERNRLQHIPENCKSVPRKAATRFKGSLVDDKPTATCKKIFGFRTYTGQQNV